MSQDNIQQQGVDPDSSASPVPPVAPGSASTGTASGAAEPGWWTPSQQGQPAGTGWGQPAAGYGSNPGGRYPSSEQGAPHPGYSSAATGYVPAGRAVPGYPGAPTSGYPTTTDPGPAGNPKPRRRGRMTLIAAVTVAAALAAGFGGGAWASSMRTSASPASSSLTPLTSSPTVSANVAPAAQGSVQQVAAAILPSVVSVLSSSATSAGEGSGIILSADGLILTNNHVIDGATALEVQFNDGTTATATVVGADATDDLAVIKAQSVSGLTPATLGTSSDLQVGQDVVAVGSPLGLSATVTSGIVSALNRPVATSDAQPQQQAPGLGNGQRQGQGQTQAATQATVISAIQTDAAINPGNSGGPLVDTSGKVIGVNSAIASLSSSSSGEAGSIGVGFAIPIDQAKRISDEIIQTGKASHAVLGAGVGDATVDGNTLLTSGATISQITAGGGAEAAGLQVGDVITKVGDQKVESADALVAAIRSAAPNSAVSITFTRGTAASQTVSVTLGSSTE